MIKLAVAFVLILGMIACHGGSKSSTNKKGDTTAGVPRNDSPATAAPAGSPGSRVFDYSSVPVSDKPLGPMPYFSLPAGYSTSSSPLSSRSFDHFAFWTGSRFFWAEGKLYFSRITAEEKKTFSPFELEKSLDGLVGDAGGVEVFKGRIPADSLAALPQTVKADLEEGLGDVYNDPATVYLIHRRDRDIWIHCCFSGGNGSWLMVETKPFVQTGKVLADSAGK